MLGSKTITFGPNAGAAGAALAADPPVLALNRSATGAPSPARAAQTVPDFGPNVTIFDPSMPVSQIQAAVDAIYTWFDDHDGNPLIVVPTGGGKSVLIAAFAAA